MLCPMFIDMISIHETLSDLSRWKFEPNQTWHV